jgi:metal-sulfur cluster biosynthetic enzyme
MGGEIVVETIPIRDIEREVHQSMETVMDPHMSVSLIDMGMVSNVSVDADGHATIGLVFPCVGCPAFEVIQHDARVAAAKIPGISQVNIKLDWAANWSKSNMSDQAKEHAKAHGYVI